MSDFEIPGWMNPTTWFGGGDSPAPAPAPTGTGSGHASEEEPASIRERFRGRAFRRIGAESEADFNDMDPLLRNTRITGGYADMYMSDPDSMKWAGMAAYASDLVGVGIGATEVAGSIPFIPEGMDMAGIDNGELHRLLAMGNAGVYDDLMWQHMAMQEGGIEMMRAAHEAGEIPDEQMRGWETIAASRAALDEARASGNEEAIAAAEDGVWRGNNQLLEYEQQVFLQNLVYDDSPAARELFNRITPGMVSPIPGGEAFHNYRHRTGAEGEDDIGDANQRWDWIRDTMAPDYRRREGSDSMRRDMRRFSANSDTAIPGLPVNTDDPLDFELPTMPDIPYLPEVLEAIPNPLDYVPDLPSIPNPLDYVPDLPSIPNPLDYVPDLPSLPSLDDLTPRLPSLGLF